MGTRVVQVPRAAEVKRLSAVLARKGILSKLPAGARGFIHKHYGSGVPYHGRLHPYMMLAYVCSLHLFDPMLLAMICGHDAGHNGIARESPEELSAIHTYAWLTRPKTLKSLGNQVDRNGLARVVAAYCRDTRFPYDGPATGKYGIWLRTADVLATLLTPPEFLGVKRETWSPFRVFLYLNLPFYLEQLGAEFEPISDWIQQKQEDGSFMGQVCDAFDKRCFVVANVAETRKLLMHCRESMRFLSGQPDRLEGWLDFLKGDVTLPEFLELTSDLGL